MAHFTHEDYDRLERAVADGRRIVISRRGTEYIVIPLALKTRDGRETIDTRNPTTGDFLSLYVDELDGIEMVGT
jgi:hypothetical protein